MIPFIYAKYNKKLFIFNELVIYSIGKLNNYPVLLDC